MQKPPSKKEVMLALLERAEARVHLDARRDGVVLPERLLADGHVRLDYGYHFTPPIPDLVVDEDGIHATLSFGRLPFQSFIPWSAIYLIADFDGNGAVWQDDIPSDLLDPSSTEPGAKLKAVPADADPADADPATGEPVQAAREPRVDLPGDRPTPPAGAPVKKPRPSHLKLVK